MEATQLIPFGVAALLTLVEFAVSRARTDWLRNLQAWLVSGIIGYLLLPLFALRVPTLLRGEDLPLWLAFPLFVLVWDLGEYLYHRAQHRIPLLWAMHSLHHSDPEMSALTTQRHFWGDQIIKSASVWLAASLVIAPTPAMVTGFFVVSLWNFFAHANLRIDFGPLSWLINCPAYHRRHHSLLPEHYNSNFAALFPIWDVLAGSYFRADGFPPTGLDEGGPQSLREVVAWPLVYRKAIGEAVSEELEARV